MFGGKEFFIVYFIVICIGFFGVLIFYYIFNYDIGEVEVDDVVYFFYFFGESDGNLYGKVVLFFIIIWNF